MSERNDLTQKLLTSTIDLLHHEHPVRDPAVEGKWLAVQPHKQRRASIARIKSAKRKIEWHAPELQLRTLQ
jgi:hypothetical protein